MFIVILFSRNRTFDKPLELVRHLDFLENETLENQFRETKELMPGQTERVIADYLTGLN